MTAIVSPQTENFGPEMMSPGEMPQDSIKVETLNPHQGIEIPLSATLVDPSQLEQAIGIYGSVPAIIEAGDSKFMIVDITQHPVGENGGRKPSRNLANAPGLRADFLLISMDENQPVDFVTGKGYKGIRAGEPLAVGRANPAVTERFNLPETVSRHHFDISFDGQTLSVINANPTLETVVTTPNKAIRKEGRTSWGAKRAQDTEGFQPPDINAPYGYLDGHRILGRHAQKIDGGVYLGGSAREAIVVDSKADKMLDLVSRRLSRRSVIGKALDKIASRPQKSVVGQLERINSTVKEFMRYEGDKVEEFSDQFNGDKKVQLGEYIERGIGVCRHMALLAGFLAEKSVETGALEGKIRIERNTIPDYGGSHAWLTFVDKAGTEYVIDPAQDFVGTKADAMKSSGRWDYYVPLT